VFDVKYDYSDSVIIKEYKIGGSNLHVIKILQITNEIQMPMIVTLKTSFIS
jgi:hypothetical protein